ncbi:AGAP000928-PB [Anopheles gambiae str. PEST]|uniref:RING-type E3 ubiquitin transferase n=1 Tax=Anopheles gambiae TaxID=7165 RepID=F5HIZ6_ANOGA|nr:AGAP000928-PB [Anopheles gambiae str. PEST]
MSLFHANAGQAEIIRTVQKDQEHIEYVRAALSEVLLLLSQRHWFRYNALCKLVAEVLYHHYAILHNLQTLGEEYTGIIQVDANYVMLPNKALQLLAILLEYGGEHVVDRVLTYLQTEIDRSEELLESVKTGLHKLIDTLRVVVPYVRGFHTSLFYIHGGKYHISKRLTGINYVSFFLRDLACLFYRVLPPALLCLFLLPVTPGLQVLIRNWLKEDHSVYGYKALGYVTLTQLVLALAARYQQYRSQPSQAKVVAPSVRSAERSRTASGTLPGRNCALCMDTAQAITVTQCGHLFCWQCILHWLDQRQVCPICRESVKKTRVVRLQNFSVEPERTS